MFGRKKTQPLNAQPAEEEITRLSVKAKYNALPFDQDGENIHLDGQVYDASYYKGTEDGLAAWMDSGYCHTRKRYKKGMDT